MLSVGRWTAVGVRAPMVRCTLLWCLLDFMWFIRFLLELAEQLHSARLLLSVAWRPRDENEEADALTNGIFTAFTPALRVKVKWADLSFKVLPRLAASAEALFKERQLAKASAKEPARPAGGGKRRKPLREKDPW